MLDELIEWWEDLCDKRIDSRALLLPAPSGWGCSAILDDFKNSTDDPDSPITLVIRIDGKRMMPGRAFQANQLKEILEQSRLEPRIVRLLELNETAGQIQLGLGLGGLFASNITTAASLLIASLTVTAAGNVWDASVTGEEGSVARAARALARLSMSVPVVVIIDDADELDVDLAIAMIRNLINRREGRTLVIARVSMDSGLSEALLSIPRYELSGTILNISGNMSSDYEHRKELIAQIYPDLPATIIERIGRRTRTFGDVFAVLTHVDRLSELKHDFNAEHMHMFVDPIIDASLNRGQPSFDAVALAWAGGILHVNQMAKILEVVGLQPDADSYVVRLASLYRLTDPNVNVLTPHVMALSNDMRRSMAAVVVDEALKLSANPDVGIIERLVSKQAVHNIREDIVDQSSLVGIQLALIRGLESLGDTTCAYEVAKEALASLTNASQGVERASLIGSLLRLTAKTVLPNEEESVIKEALTLAAQGGAAFSLEARVWAAIDLLDRGILSEVVLRFVNDVISDVANQPNLGPLADQWCLTLGFRIGRAGWPASTERLLGRIITTGSTHMREIAQAIIYAVNGAQADARLQSVFLEAELQAVAEDDIETAYRIHKALSLNYNKLGDWSRALAHCEDEIALGLRLYKPLQLVILEARHREAGMTGKTGNIRRACHLLEALVSDLTRTLGPNKSETLVVRSELAEFIGADGNPSRARQMLESLVLDSARSTGILSFETLVIRANLAEWTGADGELDIALQQLEQLVPEMIEILGPRNNQTMHARTNLSHWTFITGRPKRALDLLIDLLPDKVITLGPDHPDTVSTREGIAYLSANLDELEEDFQKLSQLDPTGSDWSDIIRNLRQHPP